MEAIARRAGVAIGVAYYHFSSREELLDELMNEFLVDHHAAGENKLKEGSDYFDRLAERMRGYMKFLRSNPNHVRLFEELRHHRPDIYRRSIQIVTERDRRELTEACARGEILDMDDTQQTILAYVMLGTGYFLDQLIDGISERDFPDDEQVIQTYISLFRRGIGQEKSND
jgi:AcrR family transcriptional regulator